jgi:hypothetical protein
MARSIYEMNLHEVLNIHSGNTTAQIKVCRVPGGWIYTFTFQDGISSTFVPLTSPAKQPND